MKSFMLCLFITMLCAPMHAQSSVTYKTAINGMDSRGNVIEIDNINELQVDGTAYPCVGACVNMSVGVGLYDDKLIIAIPMVSEIWQFDLQLSNEMQMPTGMMPLCEDGQNSVPEKRCYDHNRR